MCGREGRGRRNFRGSSGSGKFCMDCDEVNGVEFEIEGGFGVRAGIDVRLGIEVVGVVWKRTRPEGECGGVKTSSGSSGIVRDEITGSEAGAAEDVSLSPDSLAKSSVVRDFLKLTTRFFFLRPACEREWRPAPRERPVVAECMLTREGREGRWPVPSSEVEARAKV